MPTYLYYFPLSLSLSHIVLAVFIAYFMQDRTIFLSEISFPSLMLPSCRVCFLIIIFAFFVIFTLLSAHVYVSYSEVKKVKSENALASQVGDLRLRLSARHQPRLRNVPTCSTEQGLPQFWGLHAHVCQKFYEVKVAY